MNRKLRYCSCV